MKRDRMFQYATKYEIIENTGLITEQEAEELWQDYQRDIRYRWDNFNSPQMCIWKDCETETDYHTVEKEIDFRDCELDGLNFYKVTKQIIK